MSSGFSLVSVNASNFKEYMRLFQAIFPADSHTTDLEKVNGYERWIVTLGDKGIGICGIYDLKACAGDIWMDWYGLLPAYRGLGIGREVLFEMIEKAAVRRAMRLLVWTTDLELSGTKLEAFYKRNGFIKTAWLLEYNGSPVFTFHRDISDVISSDVRNLNPDDWLH